MKTVCEIDMCVGCYACIAACPRNCIVMKEDLNKYNALIDKSCVNCGICRNVCQICNPVPLTNMKKWYQGWVADERIRARCASGGIATAIACGFIENGGCVFSCVYDYGEFVFKKADSIKDVENYSGSKYVKSNPKTMYNELLVELKKEKKVLVIALPCQIAGLKKYLKGQYEKLLYCIDLVCHGTPTSALFKLYVSEHGKLPVELNNLDFRVKNGIKNSRNKSSFSTLGICDAYSLAFQHELDFANSCYSCSYSRRERIGDITLGDSWGSELEFENQRGISLILCQNDKANYLLSNCKIVLKSVDINKAIISNEQLYRPTVRPKKWYPFFEEINKGIRFDSVVCKLLRVQVLRQRIKYFAIRMGLINEQRITYQITFDNNKGGDK